MYEITREFVDNQICRRFQAASNNDQARVEVENASNMMDLRVTFLKLAISTERLRVALCEDCDNISKTELMKNVLDVKKKVDCDKISNTELTKDVLDVKKKVDCDNISKTELMKNVLDVKKKVDDVTDDIVNVEPKELGKRVQTLLKIDEAVVLAIANYNIGFIYRKYPNERPLFDDNYFKRCENLLSHNKTDPKVVITIMKVFEQLHEIWWHTEPSYESNCKYLYNMLELYIEYVEQDTRKPINLAVELGIEKSRCTNGDLTELEIIFLRSFYNSIDLYAKHKHSAFVVCSHKILQYQLPNILIFDVNKAWEWISTLCEISVYFMEQERFAVAKNYIATAEYVLKNYQDRELNGDKQWSDNFRTVLLDRFDFMLCVISRFWGIYGIERLTSWSRNLLSSAVTGKKIDLEPFIFAKKPISPLLSTKIKDSMEDSTWKMHTQVLSLRDAKAIMFNINKNVKIARDICFSVKRNNIEIYNNITIELSKTYKFQAFFEKENEKKMKWHNKRIEILEGLYDKIDKTPIFSSDKKDPFFGKLSLHLALANYSFLDIKFDEDVIRQIMNTKSYCITNDIITLISTIVMFLSNFESEFAQNVN